MSSQEKKSTFFGGAAILAAGIVIVKLIGALFRVPIIATIGSEGNAHFSNAYDIFNVLLMISTAGLPVALSKTISEANTQGRHNQVKKVFRVSLATFTILGGVSFAVLYLFAAPLSTLQGDPQAVYAVRALSPTCLFICLMAAYRGYAQGHGDMIPTSVSQILEALSKLILGILLAGYFMRLGLGGGDASLDKAYGAAGAISGVTFGSLLAFIFLAVTHRRAKAPLSDDKPESTGRILKDLMKIAIPITLGASVVPITTWLDTVQVQNLLQGVLGHTLQESNDIFGSYKTAVTVYTLPSAFMVALTASIIPAVSACHTRHDAAGAGRIAESSLRVAALLALPAGVGLSVLSTPIIRLLFERGDVDVGVAGSALLVLGVASVFVCVMSVCSAILQASGKVNLPIAIVALGSAVKLLVNHILVSDPRFGVLGASVGTLCCYVIIAVLELWLIKRTMVAPPRYLRVFVKPLVAAAVMGAAAWGTYGLLSRFLGNTLSTVGAIAVGGAVYLILAVVLRILSHEDLALMPKGEKIAKFLRL